jgi:intracellular sulfur oxidation DsrE/DsrF family protein
MKSMNKMLGALLGGAMMLGALALPATGLAAEKGKLVVQVSDSNPATWNLALNNIKNVQKDLGKDNVEVEIVAYGPGIGMLKADSEVANRINEAADAGVKVVACENTMKGQKLTRDDMNARISYVPAGVVEIMQRQQQGYAYLRP